MNLERNFEEWLWAGSSGNSFTFDSDFWPLEPPDNALPDQGLDVVQQLLHPCELPFPLDPMIYPPATGWVLPNVPWALPALHSNILPELPGLAIHNPSREMSSLTTPPVIIPSQARERRVEELELEQFVWDSPPTDNLISNVPNPESYPDPLPTPSKKRRVTERITDIACFFCRRRKIKCGGAQERYENRCKPCVEFGRECKFAPVSYRGKRPKSKTGPSKTET